MIDVIAQTPIEYSKQSRDYQVIARLYTALYNFNKMYIDDMTVWDANIDNKLSHLRAKTLNFHPKHAWDYDALDAAVSCLKWWIRHKGTRKAIEEVIEILIRINNLKGKPIVEIDYNTYTIIIKIPKKLASMGVVEDLLELIIPIGMGYRIIDYVSITDGLQDYFVFKDEIDKGNIKLLPTYKMGIGGPWMGDETSDTGVNGYPSLHLAPGVLFEMGEEVAQTSGISLFPDDTNESQGALIHYNLVTTMGEVRDSHKDDDTPDTNTETDKKWKKK